MKNHHPMPTNLLTYLFDGYPEHRGRRVKYPSPTRPIRADDQRACDVTPLFCRIRLTVPDPSSDVILLELSNCPTNEEVTALIPGPQGELYGAGPLTSVSLTIRAKDTPLLRKLAKAVTGVVGWGQTYDHKEWKFIA